VLTTHKTYLNSREMEDFENLLSFILEDTKNCWIETRIQGSSASLACDGNISIPLLKAFDTISQESACKHLEAQHRSAVRATKLKAKILGARDCLKSLRLDYKDLPASLQCIDSTIISLEVNDETF